MNREQRFAKIEKSRMFSQKEAIQLVGFTRRQLETLEKLEILIPYRKPGILYSWKQLIFLRTLYHFRQVWSLQQIDKALKDTEYPINIEVIIENIEKFFDVYLGEKGNIGNLGIYFQLNKIINLSEIELKAVYKLSVEMPSIVIDDDIPVGQGKFTMLNIPKIIEELKSMAEKFDLDGFDLKIASLSLITQILLMTAKNLAS